MLLFELHLIIARVKVLFVPLVNVPQLLRAGMPILRMFNNTKSCPVPLLLRPTNHNPRLCLDTISFRATLACSRWRPSRPFRQAVQEPESSA